MNIILSAIAKRLYKLLANAYSFMFPTKIAARYFCSWSRIFFVKIEHFFKPETDSYVCFIWISFTETQQNLGGNGNVGGCQIVDVGCQWLNIGHCFFNGFSCFVRQRYLKMNHSLMMTTVGQRADNILNDKLIKSCLLDENALKKLFLLNSCEKFAFFTRYFKRRFCYASRNVE